jgi:phosphate transport system substrate-binding protein
MSFKYLLGESVMMKVLQVALFIGILSLAATASWAGEIKVGGGGAACRGIFMPLAASFESATGIALKVLPSSPAQGLIELNDGHVDMATAAVPFASMAREAAKNGIAIDPSLFTVKEIALNKTLVFVHKSNTVKKLSKKQLKDIFSGKVTNWKNVGGANQKIIVVWGLATPGQNELFSEQILDGKPVTGKHQEVTDYMGIRNFIAETPGAIGIDPHGFASGLTKNPETPLVVSPVIAVTKGKPSADVEKLLQYVGEWMM